MDDRQAAARGAEGERRVSQVLTALSAEFGFDFADDVLLTVAGRTTQLDHVVVDRFGFLVIETKVRNALLRGTHTGKTWTACYYSGLKKPFENPLDQNRLHEDFLRQALETAQFAVPPDFIKSAAVFVDANLSALELDDSAKMRVVSLEHLRDLFDLRNRYSLNAGDWGPEKRALAIGTLRGINRTADPAVAHAHASYHGYAPTQPANEQAAVVSADRPAAVSAAAEPRAYNTHLSGRPNANLYSRQPDTTWRNLRVFFWTALGVGVLAFVVWAVWAMRHGVAPAWVWIMAFILLAALGGEEGTRSGRRGRSSRTSRASASSSFGDFIRVAIAKVVLAALVAGLFWWMFLGGGLDLMVRSMSRVGPFSDPTPQAEAVAPAAPTVQQAQLALTEAEPAIAGKVTNIDSPVITSNPPYTTFTWEFIEQPDSSSAKVKTISLSLDSQGELRGADID